MSRFSVLSELHCSVRVFTIIIYVNQINSMVKLIDQQHSYSRPTENFNSSLGKIVFIGKEDVPT